MFLEVVRLARGGGNDENAGIDFRARQAPERPDEPVEVRRNGAERFELYI